MWYAICYFYRIQPLLHYIVTSRLTKKVCFPYIGQLISSKLQENSENGLVFLIYHQGCILLFSPCTQGLHLFGRQYYFQSLTLIKQTCHQRLFNLKKYQKYHKSVQNQMLLTLSGQPFCLEKSTCAKMLALNHYSSFCSDETLNTSTHGYLPLLPVETLNK